MTKIYRAIFLIFIIPSLGIAQVPTGQWTDYLSYSFPAKISTGKDKAYCIASNALFTVNYSDNSIEKLSKITGLSDINITAVAYANVFDIAIIGYQNGNIDLLTKDNIININDLKNKAGISNKKIENIIINNKNAYLCCGFGILVLNIENKEITDVYQFGDKGTAILVNDLCFFEGSIYAATNNGLYQADANSLVLADFNNWNKIAPFPNFSSSKFKWIKASGNTLMVGFNNSNNDFLYTYKQGTWDAFLPSKNKFNFVKSSDNLFVIGWGHFVLKYTSDLSFIEQWEFGSPMDAAIDLNSNIWISDLYWGLIKKSPDGGYSSYEANSPINNNVSRVAANNGKIWIAEGGRNLSTTEWNPVYNLAGIHYYDGSKWTSLNSNSVPNLSKYMDISNIAIDPTNSTRTYFTAWTAGCMGVFENGKFTKQWNETNSTLTVRTVDGLKFSRVFGMSFDPQNNLWLTNAGLPGVAGPYSISVKTSENKWYSFDYSKTIGTKLIGDILATSNNSKWAILPNGNGLFVFDEKGTYDNTSDDEYTMVSIKTDEGESLSNDITSIAEDQEGNIWVGTNAGPVVYYNPSSVFTGDNFYASRIAIPRKNDPKYIDYLLQNERITAIAIDGGNRKWLGTASSGVFLMSPDGVTQLLNFTSENSPLPSNTINTLSIDGVTGEVFISTDRGMVSYRGQATTGKEDFENLYVFPNPVREDYRGDIIINGLMQDAQVRITDIAGNLVYACKSLGGQAVWKGTNFNGRRVNTGVYLVFCSNKDATKTKVTKLLFIH